VAEQEEDVPHDVVHPSHFVSHPWHIPVQSVHQFRDPSQPVQPSHVFQQPDP